MFKHSPTSRSHRSKGIKIKHILQICLLLAVCFWLIYQVKRSYDKGKEFEENDSGFSLKGGNIYESTKWGRKTLLPQSKETTNVKQDNDIQEEDEESKIEEVEQEQEQEQEQDQDNKFEDEIEEDRGGGDDAVDEHDQEKSEEQEDELVDSEEKNDMRTHEALYKGDDASSAVTHDTQTVLTENGSLGLEDPKQNQTHETRSVPVENQTSLVDSHLEVRVSLPNLTEPNSINSTIVGNITADGEEEEDSFPVTFTQQVNATVQIVEKTISDSNLTSIETQNTNSSSITPATHVEVKISGQDLIDQSDTSISLEEREVETDPEIQTQGSNTEDSAAE